MKLQRRHNQVTGVYRTPDDIQNLKIRVTFKTIISLIKIPQFNASAVQETATEADDSEVVELGWQEKRLSFREVQAYQFEENCKTDLEKKYNLAVKQKNLGAGGRLPGKIFTYTTEDGWTPTPQEPKTSPETGENRPFGSSLDVLSRGFEVFHVLVDLNVEIVIVTVSWRQSDGLLIVYPDFNDLSSNPYLLEVDSDTRQMYSFAVQDVSPKPQRDYSRVSRTLTLPRPPLPSDSTITYAYLMLQIVSGRDFEYDNVHVKFEVGVPYTTEVTLGSLCGSTHSSLRNSKGISVLNCIHDVGLHCVSSFRIDDFFDINFSVVSIDEWKRERLEGVATLRVPAQPSGRKGSGFRRYEVACYRVVEETLLEKLERMFIGDRKVQWDAHLNGVQNLTHSAAESRYGIQTVSTGVLEVRLGIIFQNKNKEIVTDFRELN